MSIMVATISLSLAACSSSKSIPDKDLVKIFHDAFLANAYINEKLSGEDSLLIYEPILARYGYTVDDMRFTVQTIAQRKSSRLSDLVGEASQILNEEYKMYNYQLVVLDTIDNVARRRFTRVIHSDSLIRVRKLSDTAKLHISIADLIPGEYTISFDYHIDTTDENRNSRVEAYMKLGNGSQAMRHTMMLSRYRDSKYQRKFTADTMHKELHINMFYHPENDEAKRPGMTIRNFKITRIIPDEQAVDSLYYEQMGPMLFNHKLMNPIKPKALKGKAQRASTEKSKTKSKKETTKRK